MGNGVSGDQGNLPSYDKRDILATFDRKQHDWSEQARAQEVNTLSSNPNSYSYSKSVRPSVRHTLALSQNDSSYDHGVFTGG